MPSSILTGLSAKQLRRAAALREQIDRLEKQLSALLGAPTSAAPVAKPAAKPKRKMSAAARAKIAAAQKRRWAKHRAGKKKA
jgi:hypothetical protein